MLRNVDELKKKYPVGTEVVLVNMVGENLDKGLKGVVSYVDDIGNIGVHWENGSTLALIEGVDSFYILSDYSQKEKSM